LRAIDDDRDTLSPTAPFFSTIPGERERVADGRDGEERKRRRTGAAGKGRGRRVFAVRRRVWRHESGRESWPATTGTACAARRRQSGWRWHGSKNGLRGAASMTLADKQLPVLAMLEVAASIAVARGRSVCQTPWRRR
jgi:hypothetical protein